jgi:hypothetical protein
LQRYVDDAPVIVRCLQVYDAIPCQSHFSYKCPPAPQISFAMPQPGAAHLPSLDELLQLSAAAAAGETAACGGSADSSRRMVQQGDVAAGGEGDVSQQRHQQQQQRHACTSGGVIDAAGIEQLQIAGQTTAAAAAAAAATAAAVTAAAVERCRSVMVAMPDGGDVNFYELRPVKLMDLLANEL